MIIGSWGKYNWFEENGLELIHPDDLEVIKSLMPYGKLFKCVNIVGEYVEIQYDNQTFRVNPSLFQPTPNPSFSFGEEVIVKGKEIKGIICEINWHSKESREMYHIKVNGKKKSSRYFSEDLNRVST